MVDLAGSSDPAESYFRLQPTHRCRPAAVANLCGELGPFRGRRDVRRETVFASANAAARFPTLPAATHRNGSGAALPFRFCRLWVPPHLSIYGLPETTKGFGSWLRRGN